MPTCPSCSQTNPETARFCGQCGSSLATELQCESCGAALPPGQSFCHACGRPVGAGEQPTGSTSTPSGLPTSFARGRYQVLRFLGEGAKKRVYLAQDNELGREVALALIKGETLDEGGHARVRREVQAMAELGDHPHIVNVYDIGEEDGRLYFVSPFMAGGSVDDSIAAAAERKLSVETAVRIADEIAQALEHAHSLGLVHRDLKPGNVWLAADGTAKLGDFGLAASLDGARLTQEGLMVGTVAYMPPEQALGRRADERSDLYSLGAMLYEMLTGRPPFLGDGVVAIISQHINTPPVAPSWFNPETPKSLETLVLSLLAKDPESRPQSAAAVRKALDESVLLGTVSEPCEHSNPLDRLSAGIFVGREAEVEKLRAGLDQALSGQGHVLMLVGEPGIGKTRTSEELVTYARLRGARVFWGRCYEGEGAPAYWPWVQILRAASESEDAEKLRRWLGPGAADLAQIVPELREVLPDLPKPPELEADAARFRLFEGITGFLKNLADESPIVLVIDDLHWADESSLLLLQFLVREISRSRLLVLGTYRDVELKRGHPLSETLAILSRERLSERILLRGLQESDVRRFLEMITCKPAPLGLVQAIYSETEGNPFFIHEVVRLLVSDGRLDRLEDESAWNLAIPEGVRDVVGRRLNHLSEPCNQMLSIASVIGREFDLSVLERVSELNRDELLETIEEGLGARLLEEGSGSLGRYRFSHALVRETLYEELTTPRRVRLHREIASVLESIGADRHLPELAHHYFQSIQAGTVDKAVNYAVLAAERAVSQRAYEEAAGHYDRALQASEFQEPVEDEARCTLLLALGDAWRAAGDHVAGREAFEQAAVLARRRQFVEPFAHAAVGYARLLLFGQPDPRARELLEDALTLLGEEDSALRARMLALLGLVSRWDAGRARAEELALQAVAMARRVGDKRILIHVLDTLHIVGNPFSDPTERIQVPIELTEIAESIGDHEVAYAGHIHMIVDYLEMGDLAAVDRSMEAMARETQILRQPFRESTLMRVRMGVALQRGQLDEAEKLAQESERTTLVNTPTGRRLSALQGATLLYMRGEYDAAIETIRELIAEDPEPRLDVYLAYFYAAAGRDVEAREVFERVRQLDLDEETLEFGGLFVLCLLSRVSVFLGEIQWAELLYERMLPFAGRFSHFLFFLSMGSMESYLGLLATILGRWDDAERHFEAALKQDASRGMRPFVAGTQYDYAQMCLARGRRVDGEKAIELVNSSLETARQLGMKGLVERGLALKLQLQGIGPAQDARSSIEVVTSVLDGRRPDLAAHAAHDGHVTLMFSDMEGFTSMTERLGDERAFEVIRAHNSIVRRALKAYGGHEVELQGDGFLLAFSRADGALKCAIAIQRAFADYSARHPEQPIRVRIGLHTGEAIKDADRFFGRTVILASRVADQAEGGQVLVTSDLREHLESLDGFIFDEGRELTLKGLAGTHLAFLVDWSQVRA